MKIKLTKFPFTILFILFFNFSFAQKNNYDEIDSVVFNNTKKYDNLKELTNDLTSKYQNVFYKARAIYKWIENNMHYDYEKFHAIKLNKYISPFISESDSIKAEQTYQTRKGVCEDYSVLAKVMFSYSGIECRIITGIVNYGGDEKKNYYDSDSHAWNAIRLNEKWYLLDCTWAEENPDFYFLANPDFFHFLHFPADPAWTLTQRKYSLNEFLSFPYVKSEYFTYGENNFPLNRIINTSNDNFEFKKVWKEGLSFTLYKDGQAINDDDDTLKLISTEIKNIKDEVIKYNLKLPYKGRFLLGVGIIQKEKYKIDSNDEGWTITIPNLIVYRIINQ